MSDEQTPDEIESNGGAPEERQQRKTSGKAANTEYGAKDQHLSDLEHVRERPSMYIGDTTIRGLHHLVYEVVDNSIDEAMAGYAKRSGVTINGDGSVTVEDDGRGIPVEPHAALRRAGPRGLHARGRDDRAQVRRQVQKGAYQTSGGLHGVGVTVVNFLSEWCEVEVRRGGHVYQQEYERGVPTGPVSGSAHDQARHQDHLQARPADLSNTKFIYDTLHKRLQELAFLNRGVRRSFDR
jgi:DNA gyrase subunit B